MLYYAGAVGVDPYKYALWQLREMYEAAAKERWIMHGRLNIDLINSMRGESQQLKPSDFKYPYFDAPEQTQKDKELQLAKMLQASGWAQVTIL